MILNLCQYQQKLKIQKKKKKKSKDHENYISRLSKLSGLAALNFNTCDHFSLILTLLIS